jgi:enterochelin esterase-like enzyme
VAAAVAVLLSMVPPAAAPAGHRVEGAFHSRALKDTEHYAVYLPRGYATSRERYPVIYALHGLPSGSKGYRGMPIASWGRDAEEAGRPAIVVAAQGARDRERDPEWHDWGPGRNWESAIAHEVVAHIDRRFRTIRSRRARALIGISAGGYGATIIGVRHPEVYSAVQSWSGYFHATNPEGSAPLSLGSPDADEAGNAHTYVKRIRDIYAHYRPAYFGFFVGDEDPHFLAENRELHRELTRERLPHDFAVYNGAHTSGFWAEHQEQWITAAVRRLTRAR